MPNPVCHPEYPLPTRFAFGGLAGEVLREHFNRDALQTQLSTSFMLYYRLRPLIPIAMRRVLQRERNQAIDTPHDWYLPVKFINDFYSMIRREPAQQAIHPWPDDHAIASVLTHDVETKDGLDRINKVAELEESYGLASSWNVVPHKYKVDESLLVDLKNRGHEIGVHGYNHDGRLFESRKTFDDRTPAINRAVAKFGSDGFRAPMVHRKLEWLQALDIDYDASCFDCDPFQAMPGGVGGVWPFTVGKLVELPYTLPQDHTLLVTLGETTARIWIEKFESLRRLSGMALLITHPDYLDSPKRLDAYRQFLEYVVEQANTWKALPRDVASWWRLRDQLRVVGDGDTARIEGPSADRARLFSLSRFLSDGAVPEVASF